MKAYSLNDEDFRYNTIGEVMWALEDSDDLIAAAPDMYDALILALDEIRECDDTGGVRAKIAAALAKASGQ